VTEAKAKCGRDIVRDAVSGPLKEKLGDKPPRLSGNLLRSSAVLPDRLGECSVAPDHTTTGEAS
jgi:hypothetical protein